jgi:hypothetical protein
MVSEKGRKSFHDLRLKASLLSTFNQPVKLADALHFFIDGRPISACGFAIPIGVRLISFRFVLALWNKRLHGLSRTKNYINGLYIYK